MNPKKGNRISKIQWPFKGFMTALKEEPSGPSALLIAEGSCSASCCCLHGEDLGNSHDIVLGFCKHPHHVGLHDNRRRKGGVLWACIGWAYWILDQVSHKEASEGKPSLMMTCPDARVGFFSGAAHPQGLCPHL